MSHIHKRVMLALAGLLFLIPTAHAQQSKSECSSLVVNRKACVITVYREVSRTGLPVRMRPKTEVTLVVQKRPFEDIKIAATFTEQPRPEALAAALTHLGKGLQSLVFSSSTISVAHSAYLQRFKFMNVLPADSLSNDFQKRLRALQAQQSALRKKWIEISKRQDGVDGAIDDYLRNVAQLDRASKKLRDYIPVRSLDDGTWVDSPTDGPTCLRATVMDIVASIERTGAHGAILCSGFAPTSDLPSLPDDQLLLLWADTAAMQTTVGRDADELIARLEQLVMDHTADAVLARDEVDALMFDIESTRNGNLGIQARQTQLQQKLQAAHSAIDVLNQLAVDLRARAVVMASPVQAQTLIEYKSQSYKDLGDSAGTWSAVLKVTATDVLAKQSTDLTAVAVSWAENRWEISTGILASNEKNRSYQNSPIIINGTATVDGAGKPVTEVTETRSSPAVVAVVLVHYRLPIDRPCGVRRCAFLLSAGVGTGQGASSADFALGPTFAYGSFMVSATLHLTRDQRLASGVTVGQQNLPSVPTERAWVHKVGLAMTYTLPID